MFTHRMFMCFLQMITKMCNLRINSMNNSFHVFFFKQKTAYEMRISDWSSDVCSSDLPGIPVERPDRAGETAILPPVEHQRRRIADIAAKRAGVADQRARLDLGIARIAVGAGQDERARIALD